MSWRVPSKQEFRAHLHEAGGSSVDDLTEGSARDVSIHRLRPEELRVVENVKGFEIPPTLARAVAASQGRTIKVTKNRIAAGTASLPALSSQ